LEIHQAEAARILKVSTVTLSRWECDKVYPTWPHQPSVIAYLGYDPFTNPALGRPKGNETPGVAFLASEFTADIGQRIKKRRLELRKTRKQMARELGISVKTLWGWENNRHEPSAKVGTQIYRTFKYSCSGTRYQSSILLPSAPSDDAPRASLRLTVAHTLSHRSTIESRWDSHSEFPKGIRQPEFLTLCLKARRRRHA
jgi:transcriptional regulator with XRE-family HTH domain